jgi:Ala-tRNA(Pro) deacylase
MNEKFKAFMQENSLPYEVITHPQAFTAQQVAHAIHESGKVLAKTVILEVDDKNVMCVVPAHHKVKISWVKDLLSAKHIRLTEESKMETLFPDCEIGAMPPIGPLYGMQVIISTELSTQPEIIFNAGTHRHCVKMHYADFEKAVNPMVAEISDLAEQTFS